MFKFQNKSINKVASESLRIESIEPSSRALELSDSAPALPANPALSHALPHEIGSDNLDLGLIDFVAVGEEIGKDTEQVVGQLLLELGVVAPLALPVSARLLRGVRDAFQPFADDREGLPQAHRLVVLQLQQLGPDFASLLLAEHIPV
jgi:hypothetical protein